MELSNMQATDIAMRAMLALGDLGASPEQAARVVMTGMSDERRVQVRDSVEAGYTGDITATVVSSELAVKMGEHLLDALQTMVMQDHEHAVQLGAGDVASLRRWLDSPNGGWYLHAPGTLVSRASFEAVDGGGVLVRTQPYRVGR
jgi:hypothetical protein